MIKKKFNFMKEYTMKISMKIDTFDKIFFKNNTRFQLFLSLVFSILVYIFEYSILEYIKYGMYISLFLAIKQNELAFCTILILYGRSVNNIDIIFSGNILLLINFVILLYYK